MATITITSPNLTDPVLQGVYGHNIVTTFDTDEDGIKMAIRVQSGSETYGELRQSPNLVGYCHFDVQYLLKHKCLYYSGLETINPCFLHYNTEEQSVKFQYGYEENTTTGDFTSAGTTAQKYYVIPARKRYDEVSYDTSLIEYGGGWSIGGGGEYWWFSPTTDKGEALTDYAYNTFRVYDGSPVIYQDKTNMLFLEKLLETKIIL
jgi:hypothetical protein